MRLYAPFMLCPAYQALLRDHLRTFHRMRCTTTWADMLHNKNLAEAAEERATEHLRTCLTCNTHPTAIPCAAPAWQAGIY